MAKRAGGGCTVLWGADNAEIPGLGQDRLSGIFTADAEKDYRNMLLLWDTIAVISSSAQKEQIAQDFVGRISLALKPSRVALFEYGIDAGCRQLAAVRRSDVNGTPTVKLSTAQQTVLDQVHARRTSDRLEFQQFRR